MGRLSPLSLPSAVLHPAEDPGTVSTPPSCDPGLNGFEAVPFSFPTSHRGQAFADLLAKRAEHLAKGYDAAHEDRLGPHNTPISLLDFTRARLAEAASLAPGLQDHTARSSYRLHLVRAAAMILAELDRLDRETDNRGPTTCTD